MNNKYKGFTLVELLVVVTVIGILAAIALPSYTAQIQKSRRSDVMDLLTDCAAAQARNFSTSTPPAYLDLAGLNAGNLCNGLVSKDGHYQIDLVQNTNCQLQDGSGGNASVNVNGTDQNGYWCFQLRAVPVNPGAQVNDVQCATWTIDYRGVQTALDDNGNNNTPVCWSS